MAPPDQKKKNSNRPNGDAHDMAHGDGHGHGDGEVAHPCDGSGGGSSAVDQEHKACDEHTQGEPPKML